MFSVGKTKIIAIFDGGTLSTNNSVGIWDMFDELGRENSGQLMINLY